MITEIKSIQANTLVYEIDEFIGQYEVEIIEKGIEAILKDFDKVNLMLYIHVKGENFASFIEELKMGVKYWNKINKIVYIGDSKKWKALVGIDNLFTKFKEKYFEIDDISKAWDWVTD